MSVFGREYARLYDQIYSDKDYVGECKAVAKALARNGIPGGSSILDVGCGTGRHGSLLANMGFRVTGTDLSEEMVEIARARTSDSFVVMDADEISRHTGEFDAVVSLFDVLSYQTTPEMAKSFVRNLADNCRPDGVVVWDAWHLAGLVNDPPVARSRKLELPDGSVLERSSSPEIDWGKSVTTVRYELRVTALDLERSFAEVHAMRAFTAMEMFLLADHACLEPLELLAAPTLCEEPGDDDWHIALISRKL